MKVMRTMWQGRAAIIVALFAGFGFVLPACSSEDDGAAHTPVTGSGGSGSGGTAGTGGGGKGGGGVGSGGKGGTGGNSPREAGSDAPIDSRRAFQAYGPGCDKGPVTLFADNEMDGFAPEPKCGCDGVTFMLGGYYQDKPYAHAGPCADAAIADAGDSGTADH